MNLTIDNGGRLEVGGEISGNGTGSVIKAQNITIQTNGVISADSKGFLQSYNFDGGPGGGQPAAQNEKGGSHGGFGANTTVTTLYGSITNPTSMGSGSSWYPEGGGAIKFVVAERFLICGTVSADANAHQWACGAGGSIWINTRLLDGNGVIRARGGDSSQGIGDGGGGRMAIYYVKATFPLPVPGTYVHTNKYGTSLDVSGGYSNSVPGSAAHGSLYIAILPEASSGSLFVIR